MSGKRDPGALSGTSDKAIVVIDQAWAAKSWTIGPALSTSRFWLLAAMSALSLATVQMIWVHQVAYLVDQGYDAMEAAAVAGLAGLISMPAKIAWGNISDRAGREMAFSYGTVISLAMSHLRNRAPSGKK